MGFIQRFSLLIHIAGFFAGLFSVLYIYSFAIEENFGDGELLTALLLVSSPLIGWLLRWLITGEINHFIPLKEYFIKALPFDGNYAIALILLPFLSFSFLYYIEDLTIQHEWEREVFGTKCVNDFGDKAILGYFKKSEKAVPKLLNDYYEDESNRAIHCSDYLEKNNFGKTLCTWNNGANANSSQCMKLKDNPKPSPDLLLIAIFNGMAFIMILYSLTLIRLIINLRTSK